MNSLNNHSEISNTTWIAVISRYNRPNAIKSWVQLSVNTLLYALAWYLMFKSLSVSYWITLGLSVPAAGLLVRLFIIFHDCGHGSFFRSRRLQESIGLLLGILTFTPFYSWTSSHRVHHETAGNLDKRGIGDVWTMTVTEYRNSSRLKKIAYRLYRNPLTMFGIGPIYVFLISNRFTRKGMDKKGRTGVYLTNLGLMLFAASMSMLLGVKDYLFIQLPIIYLAGIFGFWLFYIQHQFDPSYWTASETWNYKKVALEGSSYYKLPKVLQYFTGNIGFHHVHHLSPMIPNYNLSRCHHENSLFHEIKPLGFWRSLGTMRFRLWNEATRELVSFGKLKNLNC